MNNADPYTTPHESATPTPSRLPLRWFVIIWILSAMLIATSVRLAYESTRRRQAERNVAGHERMRDAIHDFYADELRELYRRQP